MENHLKKMTYAAFIVLCVGTFVSVSFSAISHVLLFFPAVYFFYLAVKNKEVRMTPSMWALLGVIISIFLSVIFNQDIIDRPLKNMLKAKYFILPLLGVFAGLKLFNKDLSDKKISILLYTFLGATTIATISGLIGLYTGFNPLKMKAACHETRACGLYGMYMTYGYGISLFQTLITGLLFKKGKFEKYINYKFVYLVWIINFIGLILSFARGGWLGFFLSLPFFFFKKYKKLFVISTVSIAIFAGITWVSSDKVKDVFLKRSTSNMQRIAFFQTAYKAFSEKPIFGWGYRNFEPNVKDLKKKYDIAYPYYGSHAHNNLLEHLASTGALGFIALVIFMLAWAYETYVISPIIFPFVINFIISGMVQYTFGDGENLFLIMGIWLLGCVKYLNKEKV